MVDDATASAAYDEEEETEFRGETVESEQELLSTPITDGELGNVYSIVESDKGYINPMQFVSVLRAVGVSDSENLKFELDLFHRFDTTGSGKVTKRDFVSGFQTYFETHGFETPHVKEIFLGIRAYKKNGTVEL
mmetsp:Transcript_3039/g.9468  ORF Transcript_3039/g.9468 Transcript_3039/m.9468 type:complete len:134 (-) Transcript_3039:210-611(-)